MARTKHHRPNPIEASRRSHALARLANVVLGIWLFASAFLWEHFPSSRTNAWSVGLLIVASSIVALRHSTARWANGALAAWLFASTLFMIRPIHISTVWNNLLVAACVFSLSLVARGGLTSSGSAPVTQRTV